MTKISKKIYTVAFIIPLLVGGAFNLMQHTTVTHEGMQIQYNNGGYWIEFSKN